MSRDSACWTGLLVSVRDGAEAAAAVTGGAAIIDVKEPLRGPLGAASAATAAAVAVAVAGRAPWTLACGELGAGPAAKVVHAAMAALPRGCARPAAAKAGPAGLSLAEWRCAFAAFAGALPADVEPVCVAYADWQAARAPQPTALVAAAAAAGCRMLLVDTFDKTGPGILDSAAAELPAWIGAARAAGMAVALAGRLTREDFPRAAALEPDIVAVRSAACGGGRLGRVERALVAAAATAWAATLHPTIDIGRTAARECQTP